MYTRDSLLKGGFRWGDVIAIHEIGFYLIAEYHSKEADPYKDVFFKPYVRGHDLNRSFDSLDKALLHAIAYNNNQPSAFPFLFNMLCLKQ